MAKIVAGPLWGLLKARTAPSQVRYTLRPAIPDVKNSAGVLPVMAGSASPNDGNRALCRSLPDPRCAIQRVPLAFNARIYDVGGCGKHRPWPGRSTSYIADGRPEHPFCNEVTKPESKVLGELPRASNPVFRTPLEFRLRDSLERRVTRRATVKPTHAGHRVP